MIVSADWRNAEANYPIAELHGKVDSAFSLI